MQLIYCECNFFCFYVWIEISTFGDKEGKTIKTQLAVVYLQVLKGLELDFFNLVTKLNTKYVNYFKRITIKHFYYQTTCVRFIKLRDIASFEWKQTSMMGVIMADK